MESSKKTCQADLTHKDRLVGGELRLKASTAAQTAKKGGNSDAAWPKTARRVSIADKTPKKKGYSEASFAPTRSITPSTLLVDNLCVLKRTAVAWVRVREQGRGRALGADLMDTRVYALCDIIVQFLPSMEWSAVNDTAASVCLHSAQRVCHLAVLHRHRM